MYRPRCTGPLAWVTGSSCTPSSPPGRRTSTRSRNSSPTWPPPRQQTVTGLRLDPKDSDLSKVKKNNIDLKLNKLFTYKNSATDQRAGKGLSFILTRLRFQIRSLSKDKSGLGQWFGSLFVVYGTGSSLNQNTDPVPYSAFFFTLPEIMNIIYKSWNPDGQ